MESLSKQQSTAATNGLFRRFHRRFSNLLLAIFLMGFMLTTTGCIRLAANVMNIFSGAHLKQAAYDNLHGKKVAVVCEVVNGHGPYSPGETIAMQVAQLLDKNIDDIEIIPYEEVSDWKDRNDWDGVDYREIGHGLKADVVIAIDVHNFNIFDGSNTFLRGKARVTTKVIDMTQGGKVDWSDPLDNFQYPANGPIATTETTEGVFRRKMLDALSFQLAQRFYAHEVYDEMKRDPTRIR